MTNIADDDWEDFTNASEWEELQHNVEQILISWGLRNKGVVTHLDDNNDNTTTTASGSMDGIQGGTIQWRSHEISVGTDTHHRLPPTTYRLTLYYGNVAAGLPRWSPGQEHLTPTMLSLLDTRQDFQLGKPFVHRIFGLSHFLIFQDVNDATRPSNQLLSIMTISLNQCNCTLPVFVPVKDNQRKYYRGISVPGSRGAITIRYESDESIVSNTSMLTTLSGLSEFLRRKVKQTLQNNNYNHRTDRLGENCLDDSSGEKELMKLSITHAVRWIWTGRTNRNELEDEWRRPFYLRSDPPSTLDLLIGRSNQCNTWNSYYSSFNSFSSNHISSNSSSSNSNSNSNSTRHEEEIYMDRNVFGPCCDPIAQLWIFASWPRFPEGAFVENHDYTSLNSDQAPEWYVRCHPNKNMNSSNLLDLEIEMEDAIENNGGKLNSRYLSEMDIDPTYVPWTSMLHSIIVFNSDIIEEMELTKQKKEKKKENKSQSNTMLNELEIDSNEDVGAPWTYIQWEEDNKEKQNEYNGEDEEEDGSGNLGSSNDIEDRIIVWMKKEKSNYKRTKKRRKRRRKRGETIMTTKQICHTIQDIFRTASTTTASTNTGPPSHRASPLASRRELEDGLDGHRPAARRDCGAAVGGGTRGHARVALPAESTPACPR